MEPTSNTFEHLNRTAATELATHNSLIIQPTVSKQLYDDVKDVMEVFGLVFEIVSLLLTLISACIYALPDMRCPTTKFLVALNSADSMAALLLTIYRLWQNADSGAPLSASFNYLSIFGALFVTVACRRMVYCFNLLLTVERFFVITFPLKARYTKIVQSPKLVIVIVVLVVQTFHVYFPLKYAVKEFPRTGGYILGYSDMYSDSPEAFENMVTSGKVLFSYVPLTPSLEFSVALVVALRRHGASRKSLQEEHSEAKAEQAERQLAVTIWLSYGMGWHFLCELWHGMAMSGRVMARDDTLWVSSLLFALLSLPSNTVEVVSNYHPLFRHLGFEHNLYHTMHLFAALLLVASRYTNFLAYLSLSTAFRRNFLRLLKCEKVVPKMASSFSESRQRVTSSGVKTRMTIATSY
ncbi:hypothetical protein ACOMHN_004272 [Nucella lapillus]